MDTLFSSRMNTVKPSAIRQLLEYGSDPSMISFGGGYPDPDLFPLSELESIYKQQVTQNGRFSLQYTFSAGLNNLRKQLADRMKIENINCDENNILITQGGQQGLDLVAKMLIDKGDAIITESPTFVGGLLAFNPYQPRYITIPMDEEGLITDILEEKLKNEKKIKFLYTVPDFHNPTGITMSLARRMKLIELANNYNFIILEDTPYREIRYQGVKLPTLKSLDTQGRVIYLGSFSKTISPGIRVGWTVASEEITNKLDMLKLAADTQTSTINMSLVSTYLAEYDLDSHINRIKNTYYQKKEIMLSAIQSSFPKCIDYTRPDGGLFLWLTFPEGFDSQKFMIEHAIPKAKVAYVPGAPFYANNPENNFARISYSTNSAENIEKGISRLGKLLHEYL